MTLLARHGPAIGSPWQPAPVRRECGESHAVKSVKSGELGAAMSETRGDVSFEYAIAHTLPNTIFFLRSVLGVVRSSRPIKAIASPPRA
jgi:hypothetical protein